MDFSPYIFTFVEGILTFVSPCLLPMLPVYMVYLAGEAEQRRRGRLIVNALAFVAGFTILFVLLGAAATTVGRFLSGNEGVLRKVSGILMIGFGLYFLGVLKIPWLERERRFHPAFREIKLYRALLFGMIFAAGWSPCFGPLLGTAMVLAGNAGTVWRGIVLLLLYSAGLGIPFLFAAVLFERLRDSIRKIQTYSRIINIVSGSILIVAGVLLFADRFKYFGRW